MPVLQAVRIHGTILTRGLTGHLMMPSLQNLPRKIWDDNTRKRVKCSLESFPRDRPRVSLLINDNYSVNFVFPSRLTGNKEQIPRKTLSPCTQTMNTQLNVRSLVAKFSVDDRAVIDEKYEGSHFLVSSQSTIVLLGADGQYLKRNGYTTYKVFLSVSFV